MAEANKYEQLVKRMGGVLMVEVEQDESGTKLDVIAHSEAVKSMSRQVYLNTLHELINKELNEQVAIRLTGVKVQSGIDIVKQEIEEVDGVLGVYVTPTEWDENQQVKAIKYVINVNEDKFDDYVFQTKFKHLIQQNEVRVKLNVSFVLFRPKSKGIVL